MGARCGVLYAGMAWHVETSLGVRSARPGLREVLASRSTCRVANTPLPGSSVCVCSRGIERGWLLAIETERKGISISNTDRKEGVLTGGLRESRQRR